MSESEPEADSSDVQCPTCDETFPTEHGLKCHHTHVHGESLVRETDSCAQCGAEVEYLPSIYEAKNRFCNDDCWGEFLNEGVEAICKLCGECYSIPPSKEDETNFCSNECQNEWMRTSNKNRGKNHPNWNSIVIECTWCGDGFPRAPSSVNDHNFCSASCGREWRKDVFREENHPHWKGGNDGFYGPNWRAQRQKALERDNYACQACGMDADEHNDVYDMDIHVHHIVRKEAFRQDDGSLDFERANSRSNLATLCAKHHLQAERMAPLYPFA